MIENVPITNIFVHITTSCSTLNTTNKYQRFNTSVSQSIFEALHHTDLLQLQMHRTAIVSKYGLEAQGLEHRARRKKTQERQVQKTSQLILFLAGKLKNS